MTEVTLGGVPIRLQAGAPVCEYSPIGGVTSRRRSGGALVKMRNWRKTAITINGAGWMGPGFAGLNFDAPLELRCTQPLSLATTALTGPRRRDGVCASHQASGVHSTSSSAMVVVASRSVKPMADQSPGFRVMLLK